MADIPIVTELNDWRTNGGVLLMTWRKFRGLEADAVVLTDLGGPARTGAQTPHDYYTAITRARRLLTMVYGPSARLKSNPTDTVRGVDHV
jgi:superfamily I DNA/RNA helicase